MSNESDDWASHATRLADWATERLVNRADAWGQYLPLDQRNGRSNAFTKRGELTKGHLARHFAGANVGDLIGLHAISPNDTSLWGVGDIDLHDPTAWGVSAEGNLKNALGIVALLCGRGTRPLLEDTNGQGGSCTSASNFCSQRCRVEHSIAPIACTTAEQGGLSGPRHHAQRHRGSGIHASRAAAAGSASSRRGSVAPPRPPAMPRSPWHFMVGLPSECGIIWAA